MKGYYTDFGYCGCINGEYMLFATEEEYYEYYTENSLDMSCEEDEEE